MSTIRGDVEENFFPFPLRREIDVVACTQPKPFWMVSTRRFHDAMLIDAFGSGSCASKHVGFGGPTVVLSETRGLSVSPELTTIFPFWL
jgi:hypothetical protein